MPEKVVRTSIVSTSATGTTYGSPFPFGVRFTRVTRLYSARSCVEAGRDMGPEFGGGGV